jgi:hypothetical protein
MQVQVVSDAQGRIFSIHKPGDIGHSLSGIGKAGIVPGPNQRVHTIDLPKALENMPLLELHSQFLVVLEGASPKLVPAKEFKGPIQAQ